MHSKLRSSKPGAAGMMVVGNLGTKRVVSRLEKIARLPGHALFDGLAHAAFPSSEEPPQPQPRSTAAIAIRTICTTVSIIFRRRPTASNRRFLRLYAYSRN